MRYRGSHTDNSFSCKATIDIPNDLVVSGVIHLLDLTGREIKKLNFTNDSRSFDFSDVSKGVYILKLNIHGRYFQQKIIKLWVRRRTAGDKLAGSYREEIFAASNTTFALLNGTFVFYQQRSQCVPLPQLNPVRDGTKKMQRDAFYSVHGM